MLDMGTRVIRARNIAIGAVFAGMLLTIRELGWTALPLFGIAAVNLVTLDRRIEHSSRPERVVAGSLLLMIALIGAAGALTAATANPVLTLLAVPVAVVAARFRSRVVWAAAGVAALTAVAATMVNGAARTIHDPLMLATVLVLLVGVTAVTTALMDAEWQFRTESALDPLTGLLNRKGLEARFAEVGEQARLLDQPVCLIMCG